MISRKNLINTVIHKPETSRGHPQTHPLHHHQPPPPPPDLCLPGLCRRLRGKGRRLSPSLTVSSRSLGRGGQVRGGWVRKVRDAPAAGLLTGRSGSSPQRAARRPQPPPGHVSSPPPPARRARGLPAFREPWGSASGGRGLGPEQGAWGGVPRHRFKEQGARLRRPLGNPDSGAGSD